MLLEAVDVSVRQWTSVEMGRHCLRQADNIKQLSYYHDLFTGFSLIQFSISFD